MPIDHSQTYQRLSAKNLIHQWRLKSILRICENICRSMTVESFCDVGCSNGYITKLVYDLHSCPDSCGCDWSDNIAVATERYPEINFFAMNLNVPRYENRSFSLITCFETLEHVGNLRVAVENILRMSGSNGTVLLSVPIEIGVVGIAKFLCKTLIYRYSLTELGVHWRAYFQALLRGVRIDQFRPKAQSYSTHFGFDYRTLDELLVENGAPFIAKNIRGSRFYILRPAGVVVSNAASDVLL